MIARILTVSFVVLSLGGDGSLTAQTPSPPVKPGLWATKMSQLDASGKEVPSPELAAYSRMAPAMRARMAEIMRGRGVQLPDENGIINTCLTAESLNSGAWQQVATESGCTTTYSARSSAAWKWHTSCAALKSVSDGETTFNGSSSYRTRMTTTVNVRGKPTTSTRIVQGTWVSAACGDVRPLTAPAARGR
ncbi:MAG: DUF3617 domain-containing protein [Vicinamibacterales bacterium]